MRHPPPTPQTVQKGKCQREHKVNSDKSSVFSSPVGTGRSSCGKDKYSWYQISKRWQWEDIAIGGLFFENRNDKLCFSSTMTLLLICRMFTTSHFTFLFKSVLLWDKDRGGDGGEGKRYGSCILCWKRWLTCVLEERKKHSPGYQPAWLMHASLHFRTPSIQKLWLIFKEISISFHNIRAMNVPLISFVKNISSLVGSGFSSLRSGEQAYLST